VMGITPLPRLRDYWNKNASHKGMVKY
jgi:hypothetical protein